MIPIVSEKRRKGQTEMVVKVGEAEIEITAIVHDGYDVEIIVKELECLLT